MIRQPLTTITINNDPTGNALKPGTQQLMKGFKTAKSSWRNDAVKTEGSFGKSVKKKIAGSIKQQKKQWGSAKIRSGFKGLG